MSTAIDTHNGWPALHSTEPAAAGANRSPRTLDGAAASLDLCYVFAATVVRYLLAILPLASGELTHWQTRAAAIPDPKLRQSALQTLCKRGNIEGAALLATLAPAAQRRATVRALVALQTAYNYLDGLSELPSEDPTANADQLHRALLTALRPGASHADYYAHNPQREDGGYLHALVEACRDALARLPSYATVAPFALAAAARVVDFQVLNLSDAHGGHRAMRHWATDATPAASGLQWWETAAGAGSSLAVHALIAAAADPHLDAWEARQIDATYAMCSYYLSAPECDTAEAQTITRALCDALGLPLDLAILMFRCRRLFHTLTGRTYT